MRISMSLIIAAAASTSALAADSLIKPGQWEVTTTIEAVDMPGASPDMLNMMKGKPRVITTCVTAADVEKGPQALVNQDGKCKFTSYSFQGGKLASVMACAQQGGEMTVTTTGTFTTANYATKSEMVMSGQRSMKMTAVAAGKLLGACK
jgi:hypothetical protein